MTWEGTPRQLALKFVSDHDQEGPALRDLLDGMDPDALERLVGAVKVGVAQGGVTARLARWAIAELYVTRVAEDMLDDPEQDLPTL